MMGDKIIAGTATLNPEWTVKVKELQAIEDKLEGLSPYSGEAIEIRKQVAKLREELPEMELPVKA